MSKTFAARLPIRERPIKSLTEAVPRTRNGARWVVLSAYFLIVTYGLNIHEPWSDEAQPWLLARDASLGQILSRVAEEHHPPLWYLILIPFAKAGAPYWIMGPVNAMIMMATAYLMLFKTRLPLLLQVLIPLSYFFLYEYSIIARNYSLAAFFIAAIIAVYPYRFDKPMLFGLCIIGLFNSHVLAFSIAFAITTLYLGDAVQYKKLNGKVIVSLICSFAGGVYLLPYMGGKSSLTSFYAEKIKDPLLQAGRAVSDGLLISDNVMAGLIVFLLCALALTRKIKTLLLLLAGIAGVLYIAAFSYTTTIRHHGMIFLILLLCYGIAPFYNDSKFYLWKKIKQPIETYGHYIMAIIILLQIPATMKALKADADGAFSGAKEAAEFIADNNLQHAIISGHQGLSAVPLLPYLSNTKCYYPESDRTGTYYIYDTNYINGNLYWSVDYAVKITHDRFAKRLQDIVFVFNYPIQPQTEKYLELLYQTPEKPVHFEEAYYIYRFKENVK